MKATCITLSKIAHEGEELLSITFPYDYATKEYVKGFKGVYAGVRL